MQMAWEDVVNAVSSGVTAAGVIVAGFWALKRFGIEAPQWTRADASVKATLTSVIDGQDLIRVDVAIRAIGHTRLKVTTDDAKAPVVSVYPFTRSMLDSMEPAEWKNVLVSQRVFPVRQNIIEAGETMDSSHLIPLGSRSDETLAYRIEFTFWAYDPSFKQDFAWVASDYVVVCSPHADENEKGRWVRRLRSAMRS